MQEMSKDDAGAEIVLQEGICPLSAVFKKAFPDTSYDSTSAKKGFFECQWLVCEKETLLGVCPSYL